MLLHCSIAHYFRALFARCFLKLRHMASEMACALIQSGCETCRDARRRQGPPAYRMEAVLLPTLLFLSRDMDFRGHDGRHRRQPWHALGRSRSDSRIWVRYCAPVSIPLRACASHQSELCWPIARALTCTRSLRKDDPRYTRYPSDAQGAYGLSPPRHFRACHPAGPTPNTRAPSGPM